MKIPRLSVIMGIYNSKDKDIVKMSIDSIINQTMTDWECIICDDGSIDDTYEFLCNEYGHDGRFIFIKNNKNEGLRVALNKCIETAKAPYLVRQDADDYSKIERFSILWDYMERNKDVDVLGTAMVLFDEFGEWGTRYPRYLEPDKLSFLKGTIVAHATTIMKRESVLNAGCYRVARETIRCEDLDLFMRMYAQGYIIRNINAELYCVREDKSCYNRKKYSNRIKESIVKYKGFRLLRVPVWGYIYVIRPLIVGLIPSPIRLLIKKKMKH